eukprot:2665206-Pyramimonas_sp.AAC.1
MELSSVAGQGGESIWVGRDSNSAFPNLDPPACPALPTLSTYRLAGVESDGPVHAQVKYLLEWNHSVYLYWAGS